MKIHYAYQTHDRGNRDPDIKRFVECSKHELIKKCVTSFFLSVKQVADKLAFVEHVINIIDDHSSDETIDFLEKIVTHFNQVPNMKVSLTRLNDTGIMASISECYTWMRDNGTSDGLVYQVQDDYLFEETAIEEMINVFNQMLVDTNSDAIVMSYNDPYFWRTHYRYASTPRVVVPGANRYWIQMYDAPCSFLTSTRQFLSNLDLCMKLTTYSTQDGNMEIETINKMFVERGILGLAPITSIALHLQNEFFEDPYIDWKERWDSVPEVV